MRDDRAAVDAPPLKGVVGQHVLIVPADLCRDEGVDLALLEDLRQSGGIAEHVRQPQICAFVAELLLKEARAVQELAHHRLARNQIAVSLDPHTARGLPAALRGAAADMFEDLRIIVLDVIVLLRLRVQENVIGILVHQTVDRGERARGLLVRVAQPPQPRRIDVRMADEVDDDLLLLLGNFLFEELHGTGRGIKERVALQIGRIDEIPRLHGEIQHALLLGIVVLEHAVRAEQAQQPVIEAVHTLVEDRKLRELDLVVVRVRPAASDKAGPQPELQVQLLAGLRVQRDVLVVLVHALIRMAVDIQKAFKAAVSAAARDAEVKTAPEASRKVLRHLDRRVEPQIAVVTAPDVARAKLPGVKRGGRLRAQLPRVLRRAEGHNRSMLSPPLLAQAGSRLAQAFVIVGMKWHDASPLFFRQSRIIPGGKARQKPFVRRTPKSTVQP